MRVSNQPLFSILLALLLLSPSSFAFDTPLSDQAVREAYFLGQRRDESMATFLNKYTRFLEPPKTGPDIVSVTFFTPFAVLVQQSSQHTAGYSAQQAALDHRDQPEFVRIVVQIQFTNSYGPYIIRPTGSRSGSPKGFVPRPYDFWKDFDVQVSSGDQKLRPISSYGRPNFGCSEEGGCILTGATLQFDFSVEPFASGSATVDVLPPEGDPVTLDFDLDHLR
ncbi:MAG: hypothetical protein DMG55_28190 [Acidobacteria bacterium]|nr:MAG: hypothetical protein DMG55_28190 [Acidobacteriota bacterium]